MTLGSQAVFGASVLNYGSNVVWQGWDDWDTEIFLAIPEPATLGLLLLAGLALLRHRG